MKKPNLQEHIIASTLNVIDQCNIDLDEELILPEGKSIAELLDAQETKKNYDKKE